MKTKRSKKIWIILSIILLIVIIGSSQNSENSENNNKTQDQATETFNDNQDTTIPTITEEQTEEKIPTCDGTIITENCEVDGIVYSTYKFYPAEEEKYHYETITTYERKITGYCTLCNDGTYSPSCATGRGACSHHGGVKEWNAPVYSEVPKQEQKKVIDSPAVPERWEKVVKEQ